MSEEELLADRLHSVSIHLLRRVRRVDVATGIKPAELSALSVVVFGGPLTLGDLAAAEQVRPPSMTRIVKLLEQGGLISRTPDKSDRRVAWLSATPSGERIMREGRSARVALLADWLRPLSLKDRNTLAQAANILERVLELPKREKAVRASQLGRRERD
jgi:DNA-binding MarR family transcriptional regulator